MIIEEHYQLTVACDRCKTGNYPSKQPVKRYKRSMYGKTMSVMGKTLKDCKDHLRKIGWYAERKWHLCPKCKAVDAPAKRVKPKAVPLWDDSPEGQEASG